MESVSDVAISPAERALIRGDYFRSGSGKSRSVLARVSDGYLVLTAATSGGHGEGSEPAERIAQIALTDLDISDRLAGVARRITLPDGSVFLSYDNDKVDALLGTTLSERSVHWLEQFHLRQIAIVLVTFCALFGVYRYGLPVAVAGAVEITPNSVIKTISKASLLGIDGRVLGETKVEAARQDALKEKFEALVAQTSEHTQSLQPKLLFRSSPLGPNALALPDGTIIVTDALVELVKDETIIGVLGHELGHVHHQHGLKLLYQSAGLITLISVVAGDVSGLVEEVLLQGAGILTLSFNRTFELEADAYSVDLLEKAGYSPGALIPFFDVLARGEAGKDSWNWLSTHPTSKSRVENLRALMGQNKNPAE